MPNKNVSSTKDKIYRSALDMFSGTGYASTSMRDLAKAVGIKHASIYNHFNSKKDILLGLYKSFSDEHQKVIPDIDEMLTLAETLPLVELYMRLNYHFAPGTEYFMTRVLSIAVRNMTTDVDSWQFIYDNILISPRRLTVPVTKRLIELGRIEPIDVDALASLVGHCCFSAISLVETPMDASMKDFEKGLKFLYSSIIRPTGK